MPKGGVAYAEEFHHFGLAQILLTVGRRLLGPGFPDGGFEKMGGKVLDSFRQTSIR